MFYDKALHEAFSEFQQIPTEPHADIVVAMDKVSKLFGFVLKDTNRVGALDEIALLKVVGDREFERLAGVPRSIPSPACPNAKVMAKSELLRRLYVNIVAQREAMRMSA